MKCEKINIFLLKASGLLLACFCALSCSASKKEFPINDIRNVTQEAFFYFGKVVYDKQINMLIIQSNESARITSEVRLNLIADTLELDIKCKSVFFNKRQAEVCGVVLPSEAKFVKIKGEVFALSELRQAEAIRELNPKSVEPTVIFKPTYFPFRGKIRCF